MIPLDGIAFGHRPAGDYPHLIAKDAMLKQQHPHRYSPHKWFSCSGARRQAGAPPFNPRLRVLPGASVAMTLHIALIPMFHIDLKLNDITALK